MKPREVVIVIVLKREVFMAKIVPDWEKQYWANRQAQATGQSQQHQQQPVQRPQQAIGTSSGDIDLTQMLAQRLMNQQQPPGFGFGNQQIPQHHGHSQSEQRVCFIKEGTQGYRIVSSDFGSEVPLVISSGPITGVVGRQFENKGLKRCFLVDAHSSMVGASIDLSKMNESPEKFLNLVQVSAPLLGIVLVPESCIVKMNSGPSGTQVLRG